MTLVGFFSRMESFALCFQVKWMVVFFCQGMKEILHKHVQLRMMSSLLESFGLCLWSFGCASSFTKMRSYKLHIFVDDSEHGITVNYSMSISKKLSDCSWVLCTCLAAAQKFDAGDSCSDANVRLDLSLVVRTGLIHCKSVNIIENYSIVSGIWARSIVFMIDSVYQKCSNWQKTILLQDGGGLRLRSCRAALFSTKCLYNS